MIISRRVRQMLYRPQLYQEHWWSFRQVYYGLSGTGQGRAFSGVPVGQRGFGLCQGCEVLNDPARLRRDAALALGCTDIAGDDQGRDRGIRHPLTDAKGQRTLRRVWFCGDEESTGKARRCGASRHAKTHDIRNYRQYEKGCAMGAGGVTCGMAPAPRSSFSPRR